METMDYVPEHAKAPTPERKLISLTPEVANLEPGALRKLLNENIDVVAERINEIKTGLEEKYEQELDSKAMLEDDEQRRAMDDRLSLLAAMVILERIFGGIKKMESDPSNPGEKQELINEARELVTTISDMVDSTPSLQMDSSLVIKLDEVKMDLRTVDDLERRQNLSHDQAMGPSLTPTTPKPNNT